MSAQKRYRQSEKGKATRNRRQKEWAAAHREQDRARQKVSRDRNYDPDKQRLRSVRIRYNLSPDRYMAMVEEQGGKCAICGLTPGVKGLVIDHDHSCCPKAGYSCGKCVRALLCSKCNTGLGQLKDDPDLLLGAAMYVLRFRIGVESWA